MRYALPSRRGGSDLLTSLVIVSRKAGEPAVSPADGKQLLNLFVKRFFAGKFEPGMKPRPRLQDGPVIPATNLI
jgi:hypothetical protein